MISWNNLYIVALHKTFVDDSTHKNCKHFKYISIYTILQKIKD